MATLLTRVMKVLYQRTKRNREPLQPKFDGDWPLLFKISARVGGEEGPIRCNGGKRPTVVPPDGVTTPDDIHLGWSCCCFLLDQIVQCRDTALALAISPPRLF